MGCHRYNKVELKAWLIRVKEHKKDFETSTCIIYDSQGLVAIFLLVKNFHIIYDYTKV